jgi:hypothetical protein
VIVGQRPKTFSLDNETIVSRNEAMELMRELRIAQERNLESRGEEIPPRSDASDAPQSIVALEPENLYVTFPRHK